MTRRLESLILNLYPLAFRRRYGDELQALLDDSPAGPGALLDLLCGAVAAHVRPPAGLGRAVETSERLRASASGVLACWVVFAAAGVAFYKTTEGTPFATAGTTRLLLGASHLTVAACAAVASLAVVIGALPLIGTVLRYARRDRGLRVLIALPVAAVGVFTALSGAIVWLAHHNHGHRPGVAADGALIAWILAGCACGAVCVLASRRALFSVPVPRRRLGAAFVSGTLVTAAMIVIVIAVGLFTITLLIGASRIASAPNGPPLLSTTTSLSLTVQLVVMASCATLATTTTLRGWRAV